MILGASCNGLSFARSLGRRGIATLLLDSERLLGSFTRYGAFLQLPPADDDPDEWMSWLEFIGSRLSTPGVLMVTTDAHSLLVSRNRQALARHFRFLIPDAQTLETIVDKRRQYEAARKAGIPIPAVHFPESVEEVAALASSMSYPCLLKPYRSDAAREKLGKRKVAVAHSKAELIAAFAEITAMHVPVMIQEIIPGQDSALFGYLAYWGADGREHAWVTKRKLRQFPPGFGDGSLQVTVDAPDVAQLSRHLLRSLNYRGFVGVEFKYDRRDGTYRLMEINPRTVSGNQLAISAGVDFPWLCYESLVDPVGKPVPVIGFVPGVRYVNEEWDVQAFMALRKSGFIGFPDWIRSLRGAQARAIGAWDDPMPLIAGIGRFLGHEASQIRSFVIPRRSDTEARATAAGSKIRGAGATDHLGADLQPRAVPTEVRRVEAEAPQVGKATRTGAA